MNQPFVDGLGALALHAAIFQTSRSPVSAWHVAIFQASRNFVDHPVRSDL